MRKTVIISLDAFYDDDLFALPENCFLRRWLRNAARCRHVKTVFPALTYPAHTTLITGLTPGRHGIGHNQPFQPDKEPAQRAWYWDASDVSGMSLFDAVAKEGGTCASILWPVTGRSSSIKWNFPEVLALPGENQVFKMLHYGSAMWLLKTELLFGRQRKSTHEPHLSDYAVVLAEDIIRRHQPDLTCVHLVDLDEMRHKHGVHSAEAKEALVRMSARVERICRAVEQTPGMEDAIVCLVSDHMQADYSRMVTLSDELAKAGFGGAVKVQSNGLTAYMFAYQDDVSDVMAYLRDHAAELGIMNVYTREQLDEMGCIDAPSFAVEAAEGVIFADALPQAATEKATHGYGPGYKSDNSLFALQGFGIRESSRISEMDMTDVAPTLAAIMGVSLPDTSGADVSWKFLV